MAKFVASNCGIYIDGYELSGRSNRVELEVSKELYDCTCFGETYRTRLPGIPDAIFSAAGYFDIEATDAVLFDEHDDVENIMTLAVSNANGGIAYFLRGVQGAYSWTGAVDRPASWEASGSTTQAPVVRGIILNRDTGATTTGNSTPIQHGAVSATQSIYAALHVFSIAGTATPTLTVKVQSDTSGFPSATDRLTFAAKTAIGSEWLSLGPGAITDDYWRVNYTISGTNPVFGFVVAFGIL